MNTHKTLDRGTHTQIRKCHSDTHRPQDSDTHRHINKKHISIAPLTVATDPHKDADMGTLVRS